MKARQVRIGIDVGETFTKAAVIDNDAPEIIGKSSVLTATRLPKASRRA